MIQTLSLLLRNSLKKIKTKRKTKTFLIQKMNLLQKLASYLLLIRNRQKQIIYLIKIKAMLKNQKIFTMTTNKLTRILHKQKLSIKVSLQKKLKNNHILNKQMILLIPKARIRKISQIKIYKKIIKKILMNSNIIRNCNKLFSLLQSNLKKIFKPIEIKQKKNNKTMIMNKILMNMDKILRNKKIKIHLKNLKPVLT